MKTFLYKISITLACGAVSVAASGQEILGTRVAIGLFYKHPVSVIEIDSRSHSLICGGRPMLGPVKLAWINDKSLKVTLKNGEGSVRKKVSFDSSDSEGLIIAHPDFGKRFYRGKITVRPSAQGLAFVEWIEFEEYMASVVAKEMQDCVYGLEDLKAQAVACRTFAVAYQARHKKNHFDFCDSAHCQAYPGAAVVTPGARQAVALTSGKILVMQSGEPIFAYYHSTCGGRTAAVSDVWGGKAKDYLISQNDEEDGMVFCQKSPYHLWRSVCRREDLQQALQTARVLEKGETLKDLLIDSYDFSHRVRKVIVLGRKRHELSGTDFQTRIGRTLGWDVLRSTKFVVARRRENFVFTGHGMGHGVGLCQWGASGMARQGYTYQEILAHYYPGTKLDVIKNRARLLKTAYSP